MKINFILPPIGDSGGMKVVYKYAEMLTGLGHDVVVYKGVICPNLHRYNFEPKNIVHQMYCSCKAIVQKKKINKYDRFVFKIDTSHIREADATIATSWPTAYQVDGLSEKCGKKWYFIQGFEIWDNEKLGIESYKLPLNKIVISSWINNQLKRNIGLGPFPIVYNGIDVSVFKPAKKKDHNCCKKILMMNHDNPVKGVQYGLEVIHSVRAYYPDMEFVMFGMNDNSNLPGFVRYYQNPSRNLLVSLYQNADIFLFPSLSDGWGLTPIEAMACGCAVVGTSTGFVLDLGKHCDNMMISEPGDVNGMVNNIIRLLDDKDLLYKLQKEGIATVAQYTWKKSASNMISVLRN